MLDRLFVEDRQSAEYSRALKEAQNEASRFEAVATLSKLEKLKAIESAVYQKLFGDDPSNMKTSSTDEAEEEILELETSPSPAGKTKKNVIDTASKERTALVQPNLSYASQASKPAAPPEVKPLDRWGEMQQRLGKKLMEEMGAAAWQRRKLINEKRAADEKKRLDRITYQLKLIPRKRGSKIHQYTSFAPATNDCRTYWSAQHGSQIQAAQIALNVRFQSVFEKDVEFRLWPEPADWKAFEKNPENGREILAKAEKFLDFWIWDFLSRSHATDRVPLSTCLAWFLKGEKSPEYKKFVKVSVTPKPENAVAANACFKAHAIKVWGGISSEIAVQDKKFRQENADRIARNVDPRTIAQPSFEEVYKKRVVDEEGCSKIVSKETTIRDPLGESSSTPKVTDGTIDTSTKDLKESRPKARQPEYNVLEVNVDGTYKMTSAKDSRGFTHISQAAADKADEEYAKNWAQASDTSLDGDNIVETDDFIKNESDSGFGTSRARNMIPVGGWATYSPNESRETSPMRTIQAVAEATDSFPVSGLNRPDDVTSGMSALSLEKTNSRSNSSQSFLLPNTEVRSENSS
ncbi:hypothetical protein H4I95_05067 [Botrytis cinerea]